MADDFTYIKMFHKMKYWEWYKDVPVKATFQHCLLSANRYPKKHKGTLIKAGSFVTSLELFAFESGLSVQQVRTSLKKLKSTGEITYESTSVGTSINVMNWADYQAPQGESNTDINTQVNKPSTNHQQTINTPSTTNKSIKSNTVINKDKKSARSLVPFGQYGNVKLTQDEYEKLGDRRDEYVSFLDSYIEEKGYKSRNHNLAIRRWVIQAVDERKGKGKPERVYELPKEVTDNRELTEADKQRIKEKMQSLGKE